MVEEENGMEYIIRAKGPALGPVGHSSLTEEGEKKEIRARRKHPTKLVKATACGLLNPLTATMGWILRGWRRRRT